jgi:hypothetical protein
MMHCGRLPLTRGIQQQRFLSASSHVIKSSLPDVEFQSTAVPDFVWQRVDQWPDKVAIVSMHRASKVAIVSMHRASKVAIVSMHIGSKNLRGSSASRRLILCTHCHRSQVFRRLHARIVPENQKPYCAIRCSNGVC